MPCSPTTSLGNPGYFNIYSNGFETIWGYFVRMETQKWVKICIFVDPWFILTHCVSGWACLFTTPPVIWQSAHFIAESVLEILFSGLHKVAHVVQVMSPWPEGAFQSLDSGPVLFGRENLWKLYHCLDPLALLPNISLSSFLLSLLPRLFVRVPQRATRWIYSVMVPCLWGTFGSLLEMLSSFAFWDTNLSSDSMVVLRGWANGSEQGRQGPTGEGEGLLGSYAIDILLLFLPDHSEQPCA